MYVHSLNPLNVVARLVFGIFWYLVFWYLSCLVLSCLRRYDHVTTTSPMSSRYYNTMATSSGVPERVNFRLALMAYRVQHNGAGVFKSARSGIRPARSWPSPVVIYTRDVRSVVWQPLAVARFLLQPQLPGTLCLSNVQSSPSIVTFRQRLKTFLFQQSFADINIWHYYVTADFVMAIATCILATLKNSDWLIDWLIDLSVP